MVPSFRPQGLLQHLSAAAVVTRRAASTSRLPPARSVNHEQQWTPACLFCQYRCQSTRATFVTGSGSSTVRSYSSRSPVVTTSGRRNFASVKPSATTSESNATNPDTTALPNGPDITNHYTIFPQTLPDGPPSEGGRFDIPLSDLRREFLRLQAAIHPDKFPSGAAKQRAEALSARINEAYRTLSDPLLRAQYLLREWHGIDVTAEEGAAEHALDAETLMEVMEVQETVEEVSARGGEEAADTVADLKRENERRVEECVRQMGEAFDAGDIEAARKQCVRLRFWYSVGEGLREWEPGRREIRLVH